MAKNLDRISFFIVLVIINFIVAGAVSLLGLFGFFFVAVPMLFVLMAFAASRLRHIGLSGRYAVILLIPLLNIAFTVFLLFAPGGAFGDAPSGREPDWE